MLLLTHHLAQKDVRWLCKHCISSPRRKWQPARMERLQPAIHVVRNVDRTQLLWYLELIRLRRSSDSVGNNNTSHDATIYTYTEACEHGPGRRYGLVIATRRDDGYWNEVQEQPKSPAIFANGRTELNVVASRNESRGNYRCFQ